LVVYLKILSPINAGALLLKNRLVMASLTRIRAGGTLVPNALMAEYYSQRAAAAAVNA
jgi:2,4-dienoyl-CoA reductase-like NADH-dependent reductase (Old Yellow Enzyme family)